MDPIRFLGGSLQRELGDPQRAPHVVVHLPGNIREDFVQAMAADRHATIEKVRSVVREAFAADHRLERISVAGAPLETLVFHVDQFIV